MPSHFTEGGEGIYLSFQHICEAEPGLRFTSLLSHRVMCTHIHAPPYCLSRDCYTQNPYVHIDTASHSHHTCPQFVCMSAHVPSSHTSHMVTRTPPTLLLSFQYLLIYPLTHVFTHHVSLSRSHVPPSCCRRDELTLIWDPTAKAIDPGLELRTEPLRGGACNQHGCCGCTLAPSVVWGSVQCQQFPTGPGNLSWPNPAGSPRKCQS